MASTFIKRTCPQGTPWTLEVFPASSSCVPNHENNEIRINIAVEVSGDTDEWAREHEDDFICVESWQEEKRLSSVCGSLLGSNLVIPPSRTKVEGAFEIRATVTSKEGGVVASITNVVDATSPFGHCAAGAVVKIPKADALNLGGVSGLRVLSPRVGDVVHGDSAVLSASYTQEDSSIWPIEGTEICIGYTISDVSLANSLGTFFGCLKATGQFTELSIPLARESDIIVTAEVTIAEGIYAGAAGWTQFSMRGGDGRKEECGDDEMEGKGFAPGTVVDEHVIDANLGGFQEIDVLAVMAHWQEDLSWLEFSPFPTVIYEKHPSKEEASGRHYVPKNVAGEATSYLKFIVDYYDVLPRAVVFLHSHRYAYHQEDLLIVLHKLAERGEELKDAGGWSDKYCNFNNAVWGYQEDTERSWMEQQWREWLVDWLGDYSDVEGNGGRIYPHPVLERCCAQFIVGRDRIRLRSKAFWERALEVMYSVPEHPSEESRKMGLLLEWIWHGLFGEEWVIDDETVSGLLGRVDEIEQASLSGRAWCIE
ncbi:hypothetical protein TrVE_jg5536 [Triparma verrucosa]|uniref:Uncharacterized protein n=1 Tax=Triparma verrucosa TaxID=1606542 RepID=A0A9W7BJI2_9STRA|nr:hypothetical protein TrVE_jg5536 [Triparma verrucosa]